MNIARALKHKNRLAGEVALLRKLIHRHNRYLTSNRIEFDTKQLYNELLEKTQQLFSLKSAIARASAPIANELAELGELKGHTLWLGSIPSHTGAEENQSFGSDNLAPRFWDAQLTGADLVSKVRSFKEQIDTLQDRIDEFNAATRVDWHPATQPSSG